MGVEVRDDDVALRCNLICLQEGERSERLIKNHSAGHIGTEEASQIIDALDAELGGNRGALPVEFFPGISYRHLLLLRGGWASAEVDCAPPHDHLDERAADLLPRPLETVQDRAAAQATADRLTDLCQRSIDLLRDHPVNVARRKAGEDEATCLWTWSPGCRPAMKTLSELYGVRGAVISAVDLIMGMGTYAGMDVIKVPGATGLHDTNYEGKAQACLDALADHDLVYVHVEATDEASHSRDLDLKIKCIEYLDDRLVRPILEGLDDRAPQWTVAILPDHPTPVETGQHGRDPVPLAIWSRGEEGDDTEAFDEANAARGSLGLMVGDQFIRRVVQGS